MAPTEINQVKNKLAERHKKSTYQCAADRKGGERGQNYFLTVPLLVFTHHRQIVNDAKKIKSKGSVNIHKLT